MIIEVDLRNKLGLARDQLQRPTCLAFATSSAHEFHRKRQDYLSPEYLFYCAVNSSHKDPGKGVTEAMVARSLLSDGQPPDSVWEYIRVTPNRAEWVPPTSGFATFRASVHFRPRPVDEIRALLSASSPVLLVVELTSAMFQPGLDATIGLSKTDKRIPARHALLAVGSGHTDDGNYVLVRNSWGLDWGNAGHCWLHESYLASNLKTSGIISGTL